MTSTPSLTAHPDADKIELLYRRMKDVVDILQQELEDAEMVLHYTAADDSRRMHNTYMRDRTLLALAAARTALQRVQELAYEHGAIDTLPA